MIIELENSRGLVKSFVKKAAEAALSRAENQKGRNQTYWKVPDESEWKYYKGSIVVRKKKVEKD